MLPDATIPASLLAVLGSLRGCFTYPGFSIFAALVTGLIADTGRGTVTGMLLGAGLTRHWSHDRAHAFFARASWDAQMLGAVVSHLVVRHWRWSIEATFAESREMLSVGQARSRTRAAVERTVPCGLYCYTITVLWYALHGHHPQDAAEHRTRAPWYITKRHPAFSNMAAKLRRTIIAA